MKKYLIIIILVLAQTVFANNDKEILRNQANRLLGRRQYEKVITLYRDWLEEYPNDIEIAGKLIDSYLLVSKISLAEELLERYKNRFPAEGNVKYNVLIDLRKGEYESAFKRSRKFLGDDSPQAKYLEISKVFETNRQYEFAAKLIITARNKSGNPALYARELALNYFSAEKYEESIREFFLMLNNDERYHYFAASRIRLMLDQEPDLISDVSKHATSSSSKKAKELLADAYTKLDMYEEAIAEYENLELKQLWRYAKNLVGKEKNIAAIMAFESYIERSSDARKSAEAKIEIAQLELKANDLEAARALLMQIYYDEKLASKKWARSTTANAKARELLAEIALREQVGIDKVIKYLEEAKKYALHGKISNELDLKIGKIYLMQGDFTNVEKILARFPRKQEVNSEILDLTYQMKLMQASAEADSLLGEVMIHNPNAVATNDALFLKFISEQMEGGNREKFFQAYRAYELYHVDEAVVYLEEIYTQTKNEQLLILAADWLRANGEIEQAKLYYSNEYSTLEAIEYAKFRLAEITGDQILIADFLQDHNKSIFSAKFRKLYKNR